MLDEFLKYGNGDFDHEVIQSMFCLHGVSVTVVSDLFLA